MTADIAADIGFNIAFGQESRSFTRIKRRHMHLLIGTSYKQLKVQEFSFRKLGIRFRM
jgi:hypothetical protein